MNRLAELPGSAVRWAPLVRKELREILRDRRTILTLVLMPLLLYPLLSIAFRQFFLTATAATPEQYTYVIGFRNQEEAGLILELMHLGEDELARERPAQIPGADKGKGRFQFEPKQAEDPETALRKGEVQLAFRVTVPKPAPGRPAGPIDCEILYLEGSVTSGEALELAQSRLLAGNLSALRNGMSQILRRPVSPPLRAWSASVSPERKAAFSLGALVPLILVLMTITGAVYPAIDLTAGERERGTLEVLMAAPVSRVRLLLAKYAAVFAVAVLTALFNLIMMSLTVVVTGLGPILFGESGVTLNLVLGVLGLLLLFASFFSAMLLAITSFARSFKEAQAYLIPLMLAAIAPGVLALMPSVKLTLPLAVLPLVNVVILARDLFEGRADPLLACMVVLATLLYASAAIALAARIFGAEAVLYRDQGGLGDAFRRPSTPRPAASVAGALLVLALLFPLQFLIGGALALQTDWSIGSKTALLTVETVLLFAGLPLVLAAWGRVELRSGFGLRQAPWLAYPAAVLLGLALVPLVGELAVLMQRAGLVTLAPQVRDQIAQLLAEWRRQSPLILVLTIAVLPAIAEELLFRGYLFSAMAERFSMGQTIVVTALTFGLFHILVSGEVALERLFLTALLGLVLGWVRAQTGSIWPGILMHAAYNATLALSALTPKEVGPLGGGGTENVPVTWLAAGAVVAVGAAAVLWWGRRRPQGG